VGCLVQDVKQPVLPRCCAEDIGGPVGQRSLVEGFDEGEWDPIFVLSRQPDFDTVLIPDHCRSVNHCRRSPADGFDPSPITSWRSISRASREAGLTFSKGGLMSDCDRASGPPLIWQTFALPEC